MHGRVEYNSFASVLSDLLSLLQMEFVLDYFLGAELCY